MNTTMAPTSTTATTRSDANANTTNSSNNTNGNNNGNRQQTKMLLKRRQLSGYESSSPEDNCEDDEVDETFVALQKLLKALNRNARQSTQVVPTSSSASVGEPTAANTRPMGIARSNDAVANTTQNAPSSAQDQQRLSQEEILESRRQERERFRHMLFSKRSRPRSRRTAQYLQSEEEEEDEEPVSSVESTISNRVINGSFSRFNVHVISRDRWAREEVERLPIVLLPENGKVVSPAENPKLNVCFTQEFMELRDDLMAQLNALPEMSDHSRLLTPPQSTWYMQMRHMDGIHC